MPLPFKVLADGTKRVLTMPQQVLLTFLFKGSGRVCSITTSLPRQCTREKNTITPSPMGWLSTPAYMTSGETHEHPNLSSGWRQARSYDAKGGEGRGWGSFLFPGGRTVRAVILNRAKFAEWLRTPQRRSGKWPHL